MKFFFGFSFDYMTEFTSNRFEQNQLLKICHDYFQKSRTIFFNPSRFCVNFICVFNILFFLSVSNPFNLKYIRRWGITPPSHDENPFAPVSTSIEIEFPTIKIGSSNDIREKIRHKVSSLWRMQFIKSVLLRWNPGIGVALAPTLGSPSTTIGQLTFVEK